MVPRKSPGFSTNPWVFPGNPLAFGFWQNVLIFGGCRGNSPDVFFFRNPIMLKDISISLENERGSMNRVYRYSRSSPSSRRATKGIVVFLVVTFLELLWGALAVDSTWIVC